MMKYNEILIVSKAIDLLKGIVMECTSFIIRFFNERVVE